MFLYHQEKALRHCGNEHFYAGQCGLELCERFFAMGNWPYS
jgi:hypothetical protein